MYKKHIISLFIIATALSGCDRQKFEEHRKALSIPEPRQETIYLIKEPQVVWYTPEGERVVIEDGEPMSQHSRLERESLNEIIESL